MPTAELRRALCVAVEVHENKPRLASSCVIEAHEPLKQTMLSFGPVDDRNLRAGLAHQSLENRFVYDSLDGTLDVDGHRLFREQAELAGVPWTGERHHCLG